MILVAAELSSLKFKVSFLFRIVSHSVNAGRPSPRTAWSAATISASGVECDTAVCFLDCAAKGAEVLGPAIFRNVPDVERDDLRSDVKSASEYN